MCVKPVIEVGRRSHFQHTILVDGRTQLLLRREDKTITSGDFYPDPISGKVCSILFPKQSDLSRYHGVEGSYYHEGSNYYQGGENY